MNQVITKEAELDLFQGITLTKFPRSSNSMTYGFRREASAKDEWLTPPEIVRALGQFDLDPCSPINRPWPTAQRHLTIQDDGLSQDWTGRVWCNPPYSDAEGWLERCANHCNAVVLIFARTETQQWFDHIWPRAHGILFLRGRLTFYNVDGQLGGFNAGAPSCLVAYGMNNLASLQQSNLPGKIITL